MEKILVILIIVFMVIGMYAMKWAKEKEILRLENLIENYFKTDNTFYIIEYIDDNGIRTQEKKLQVKPKASMQIDFKKPIVSLTIMRGVD